MTAIKVGTVFLPTRKKNRIPHTVVDILRTYNLAGECVRTEYMCTHTFLGQVVTSYEIATTILRGFVVSA